MLPHHRYAWVGAWICAVFGCSFDTSVPDLGGTAGPMAGDGSGPTRPVDRPADRPADQPQPPTTSPMPPAEPDAGVPGGIAPVPPGSAPAWCWDRPFDFDPPRALDEVNSPGDEEGPFISADGRTLLFSSDRGGNDDLYRATRAGVDLAFEPPRPLAAFNTGADERSPVLTMGEAELYFVSDRVISAEQGLDVWSGSLGAGNPARSALSTAKDDLRAWITPDGLQSLVLSDKDALYRSRPTVDAAWPASVKLSGLDCAKCRGLSLSPDGAFIILAHKSGPEEGQYDLKVARREGARFGPLEELRGVNDGESDEVDAVLSADGCTLYFASDRADHYDLYVARRR